MAAVVDMSNGRANIAVLASEGKAWHGMGQDMPDNATIAEWQAGAGLNWKAVKAPSGFFIPNEEGTTEHEGIKGDWRAAQGRFNVVRNDTIQPLGEFSDRYKIHQPSEILGFFDEVINLADGFQMCAAGALRGGRVIWAQAVYQDTINILGEAHKVRLLCATSFDGSLATLATGEMERVVCANTLGANTYAASKNGRIIRLRHNADFHAEKQNEMRDDLAAILAQHEDYKAMAEKLNSIKISRNVTEALFKRLTGVEKAEQEVAELKAKGWKDKKGNDPVVSARTTNQFDKLIESLNLTIEEGTQKNTAWTAFNAVTRYVDWTRPTRKTNGESEVTSRLDSRWFGNGADFKRDALNALLEAA